MEDGKLHKGFYYNGYSNKDNEIETRKRSLSTNQSSYYGTPYRIYSATPGYQYKDRIRINNYIFSPLKLFPIIY